MKRTRSSERGAEAGDQRCPGKSVQDVYQMDQKGPPPLLQESVAALPDEKIFSTDAYTSREFHELEMERMWSRVWQVACREEEIPDVGDHVVYDIGQTSLIVIRSAADEIRAFHNSCLHRGALLRECDGHVDQIRCPFHSFTWDLSGELVKVPCRWDFPELHERDFKLPEARLDTWGGFVFVNLDADAEPLSTYLERVPQDFERWPLEERFTAAHVAKELDCNWKIAIEAFIELYHVIGIHPQALPFFGDANAQYDLWPGNRHTSRMISLSAVASPHLHGTNEQRVLDAAAGFGLCEKGATVPEGKRARDVVVEQMRERFERELRIDSTDMSDTEILDVIQYAVFPNLVLFAGLGSPIVYRSRPVGDDPGRCFFEIWLLLPVPDDSPRPPPAARRLLSADEPWSSAEELGYYGPILDQDFDEMPRVQRGLRASKTRRQMFSNYQESRIRLMRQTLDDYLEG
ncbi:MAG: (2Fe-2S)-binding protein [Deltaproteobacteria bacterium]|nr:(2Fe-2S)-binding protein [Deltaproteobacteria bacterium]